AAGDLVEIEGLDGLQAELAAQDRLGQGVGELVVVDEVVLHHVGQRLGPIVDRLFFGGAGHQVGAVAVELAGVVVADQLGGGRGGFEVAGRLGGEVPQFAGGVLDAVRVPGPLGGVHAHEVEQVRLAQHDGGH